MPPLGIVITDSSVLINFLAIDRMDLIAALPNSFFVTNHVANEIIYEEDPEIYERFQDALRCGILEQIEVTDLVELEIFGELYNQKIGYGESSAIAVAINRGYDLAIDDRKAIKAALAKNPELTVLKTQDLIVECIQLGVLDIDEADAIKNDWEQNHHFILKFNSFADQIGEATSTR